MLNRSPADVSNNALHQQVIKYCMSAMLLFFMWLSFQAREAHAAALPRFIFATASLGVNESHSTLPDPTRPSGLVTSNNKLIMPVQNNFILTAIFKKGDQQYAVVNNEVMAVGDTIANKRVVSITQSNVILKDALVQNDTMVLELFGSTNVKTQVVK